MKLTQRKNHILQLASLGMTVKEIARELNISISAVEKHLIGIRGTLNAKNTANAVYIACKIGLILYAGFMVLHTDNYRRCSRTARREQSSCVFQQGVA